MVASARLFQYYDEPEVASALPSSGPASGGTDVLVAGSGFFRRTPLADHSCAFIAHAGAVPVLVPATLSGCDGGLCSEARCRSPALSSALALGDQFVATLSLVFNGQQASAAGVNFTVYPLPQVDSVRPTACPNTGGTIVQLSGRNLAGPEPGLPRPLRARATRRPWPHAPRAARRAGAFPSDRFCQFWTDDSSQARAVPQPPCRALRHWKRGAMHSHLGADCSLAVGMRPALPRARGR